MGNSMIYYKSGVERYRNPDTIPGPLENPSFDPHQGFPGQRKERVMIATKEEMVSAKIPLADRDYCAHLLLKYRACYKEKFPLVARCHHEKHSYLNCQFDDFVIRMKEYEREKRLRIRAKAEAA